jgi:hypothetical protein
MNEEITSLKKEKKKGEMSEELTSLEQQLAEAEENEKGSAGSPHGVVLKVGVDVSATAEPEARTKRQANGLAKNEGNSEMSATDKEARFFAIEKKGMQEYYLNNYPCDTSDCNTGHNHCCSMCKVVKGVFGTSHLEDSLSERLAEAVLGNLFGGCVLKYDENKETALHKLLEWHTKYPPTEGDNRNMDTIFDIPHSPCLGGGGNTNGTYRGYLMRVALFEVRQSSRTWRSLICRVSS